MIYLYVGIAILVLGGAAYLIYRKRSGQSPQGSAADPSEQAPEREESETVLEEEPSRITPVRPVAAATRGAPTRTTARPATPATRVASRTTSKPPDAPATEKATYPIKEYSTLSDDAKLQFMNAVWYRCENPYCNHTEFLDVHHIVDDGSNNLNNLIVLCPRCNTAAHNNEITVEELKSWLVEREKRFKAELDWPYK